MAVVALGRWRQEPEMATAVVQCRLRRYERHLPDINRKFADVGTKGFFVGVLIPRLVVVGNVAGDPHGMLGKVLGSEHSELLQDGRQHPTTMPDSAFAAKWCRASTSCSSEVRSTIDVTSS